MYKIAQERGEYLHELIQGMNRGAVDKRVLDFLADDRLHLLISSKAVQLFPQAIVLKEYGTHTLIRL
jgi:hypothetical protein